MIKGAQKQMIVLRTGDSRYFDEAYFVLRREIQTHRGVKNDILREANRILEENRTACETLPDGKPRRRLLRGWLLFLAGLIIGGAIVLGLMLLL